ncbi:MAG: formimidoylglutamase, partial [Paracoccus sp. (in: a-proteobacteria)]|nr:formimidoylglutamase [Paracoccus sp. (in: a-proteobacteria)]
QGFGFADLGDVVVAGDALEAGQAEAAARICNALSSHDRVIVLGGGHETAFASWSGLRKAAPGARIGIVNIDAHLDLRLPGAAGASSGTAFTQIRQAEPDRFDYLALGIATEGNTQALFTRASDWGTRIVSDHALLSDPMAADAEIAALIARNDLVYLTLDLDVLPHWQAPGVSAPAARGLPLAVVEHLIAQVRQAGPKLRLADVVELCPPQDRDAMTAKTAAYLVRHLMLI